MSDLALVTSNQLDVFDGDNWAGGINLDQADRIEKEFLVGMPFRIINVTFWIPTKGNGMASFECVAGTRKMFDRAIARKRVPESALADGDVMLDPGEFFVFNDGGTGIRRSVVAHLHATGAIDVGHDTMPETGELGECRWDLPWCVIQKNGDIKLNWKSFTNSRMQGDIEVPSFPLGINVNAGLRPSEYTNAQGENTTYYLK